MATTVFFTSGTSLTIPSDYNNANNNWIAIGAGGGGSYSSGAGGGEYRKITNASYTSSATRTIQIGAGGAGATTNSTAGGGGSFSQLLADNNSTVALKANGGAGVAWAASSASAGGTGGTGAGGNANGGAGGSTFGGAGGAGAGGGAGGPSGAGGAGGSEQTGAKAGSGGGGSNGGAAGGGQTNSSTTSGANGGNGQGGTGGGAGSTNGLVAGTAGTAGTGGGGGGGAASSPNMSGGGNGATGSIWTQTSNSATAGPGGGGGSCAGDGSQPHGTRAAGNGGLYGGGGGGDGNFSSGTVKGGSGAQGIIVLTYTPASSGSPYTMPAATGAITLTGIAATLTKTTAGANPVQKNGGTVSANASIATSLPGATTAGNTILIFASGGGTITTPSGFTSRSPAVNALGCYIFEKLVASGNSTDTPTLTMSGAYDAVWQIAEYKNITAYDTSASTFAASTSAGPYSTPTITPASGNKRIVGFIGSTVIAGGFVAGDPQSWSNSFIGQQSNLLVGPGGAGRTPIASGWSDLLAAANGASSYSTAANIGIASVSTLQPHSIIAAYTTTDTPPVNPWPTFRSISSVGYASHTNTVVTAPTGIIDGDILILTIAVYGTPTPAAVTLPSGFTLIDKSVAGAGGFNVNMSVAWKRASSESGSYTITHATANTNAFIAVYSGCIASGSPVDAYIFNTGLGTTTDTTNLVSSVANTTALYIDHDWTAGGGRSPPTPMVERYENLIYLSDNPLPTSGTSGRVIATNSNVNGSDPWAAWSVLLKPAVSTTTVFFVSGTSLTIPSDYNSANNSWEAIGAGAGASYRSGAGGGEYRKITNAAYTSSASRTCQIGAGGTGATTNGNAGGSGTFTQLLADNNSTVALKAFGATGPIYNATAGTAGGTGGTGAGGNANGGAGGTSAGSGGGAGGAAGGPSGVGAKGGDAPSTIIGATQGGGGGGGSNGGSAGAAGDVTTGGGTGGNGQGGTGGGAGSANALNAVAGSSGTAGTGGGGGGGGGSTSPAGTNGQGGAGATGSIWTQTSNSATAGPGGGGGGAGTGADPAGVGGSGGLYGGGGGATGNFGTGSVAAGSGAQGIIVLTYTRAAGGSPYTMPAATGSVTLAGTVAGLRAARILPAAKGSIALAGLATGLRVARRLTAVPGAITLTGFAAGLVYSSFKTLTAAVGSITLAGQAATFRLTRVMAAAKGTINLTGFDVVLTKTSAVVNKILTAAAGAFTFVGQDAALRRERRLPAAPGAITLAGQAAVLRVARKLAAAKGTITLAGSDTLLLKGKSPLLATTGAILVAGNTANLVYRASYRMAAASASIRLAAREAGLSRSGTEQPGVMEFGRKAYLRRW